MKKYYFLISIIAIVLIVAFLYISFYNKKIDTEGEDIGNLIINSRSEKSYLKLEDLPQEYSTQQAIDDKCFVVVANETYNKETLDEFVNNVNEKKEDTLRIVQFTVEGDKIITDLEYLKDDTMSFIVDNTRDEFSSQGDRKITRNIYNMSEYKIIEDEHENRKYLYLENSNQDFNSRIFICGYHFELTYNTSFELLYERRKDLGIYKIIETGELEEYNYDIYSFGGNVKIKINDETITLKEALLQNRISMDDIIHKCVQDDIDNKIKVDMYLDGGTTVYQYDEYWIIKCYSLDNNRDVYIGMPNMYFTGNTVKLTN